MSRYEAFIKARNQLSSVELQKKSEVIIPNKEVFMHEYSNGVSLAEDCCIPGLSEIFSWKKGFQNVFCGFPNEGKSTGTIYLMLVMSIFKDWKWCIWSPEEKSSSVINNQVFVHYNDLINTLIWMMKGKTPYVHISKKYNCELLSREETEEAFDFICSQFIFIEPSKTNVEGVSDCVKSIYENEGFDGVLIDPFKNIRQEINKRDDIWLSDVFSKIKEMAINLNVVWNWIGHPKANVNRIQRKGEETYLLPCNQFMLNGGAAWDNSMDGIYSWYRPNTLEDKNSPNVNFLNLKQRKQQITTPRGDYDRILFEVSSRQYIFGGLNPISGKMAGYF